MIFPIVFFQLSIFSIYVNSKVNTIESKVFQKHLFSFFYVKVITFVYKYLLSDMLLCGILGLIWLCHDCGLKELIILTPFCWQHLSFEKYLSYHHAHTHTEQAPQVSYHALDLGGYRHRKCCFEILTYTLVPQVVFLRSIF